MAAFHVRARHEALVASLWASRVILGQSYCTSIGQERPLGTEASQAMSYHASCRRGSPAAAATGGHRCLRARAMPDGLARSAKSRQPSVVSQVSSAEPGATLEGRNGKAATGEIAL